MSETTDQQQAPTVVDISSLPENETVTFAPGTLKFDEEPLSEAERKNVKYARTRILLEDLDEAERRGQITSQEKNHILAKIITGGQQIALDNRDIANKHKELALIDPLSGLPNRRWFEQRLDERIKEGSPFYVAIYDIDKFKSINDTFGHPFGDRIIGSVKAREGEEMARIGGEEFVQMLNLEDVRTDEELTEEQRLAIAVGRKADDIEAESRKIFTEQGFEGNYATVSIGIAKFAPGDDSLMLMTRADLGLYHAKNSGRNTGYFVDRNPHSGAYSFIHTPRPQIKNLVSEPAA